MRAGPPAQQITPLGGLLVGVGFDGEEGTNTAAILRYMFMRDMLRRWHAAMEC